MANTKKIATQLQNRKNNLAVVQEAIQADARSGEKLVPVRDFLYQRIEVLERELST